jgi:hypothetical protein
MQDTWPDIPYPAWRETCTTLHMWLQIVGKYRLARTPWLNHSWHAVLYPTARGLGTGLVPDEQAGIQIEFDLIDHRLIAQSTAGSTREFSLEPMSVAAFDRAFRTLLAEIGATPAYDGRPNEVPNPVPFAEQTGPGSYDAAAVTRFWQALIAITRVFQAFRTGFLGQVSPVHLFWGSFDLAVTRFSGRAAPLHPGGIPALPDRVTREAYSHEVSSAGFWPGGGPIDYPAFYAYAYPTPAGFDAAPVEPGAAFFEPALGEFILPYDAVRCSGDPEATLMRFLETTYDAAADLGHWDRAALECATGRPGVPRRVDG